MATLFTKIIAGEIPSYKIYENEYIYAFLAKDQINPGHTLVVPKVEVDYFADVPSPHYEEVFLAARPIAKAIDKAMGCLRVGTMVQGLEVPHFHCHLIPINGPSDLDFKKAKSLSHEEMLVIQKKLVDALAFD